MGKMVRFAVYTNEEKTAQRVSAFLRAWAEEICVELQLAMESGSPAALDADGCALLLVDSAGLAQQDIACLQAVRAAYPDCGLVLLAEDDRTAIDVYQCHPNALVPKPVTYSGLDAALEESLPQPPFLRVQKSFVVHLGAVRRVSGGELIMCNDRVISVARGRLRQVQEALAVYRRARGAEEG